MAPTYARGRTPDAGLSTLALVLGDQLSHDGPALARARGAGDRVLMIEAPGEAAHVWSHKARIAIFLSAMRHFAAELAAKRTPLTYVKLDGSQHDGFAARLGEQLEALRPARVVVTEPGEWRVLAVIQDACAARAIRLEVLPDPHFICSREAFAAWAGDAKSLRMEFFYRTMRRQTNVLMRGREPEGGTWNYDKENRSGFGKAGPGLIPAPATFAPDAVTRAVIAEVESRFPAHPGRLDAFDWPVTRADALHALEDFAANRLGTFGVFQDAMWTDTPYAWHARLSAAMNLKLLDPREVIDAAVRAYRDRRLPIASVEGFVRQVLGWREFMRGVYWLDMPGLAAANHFGHDRALPRWYWTAETDMRCMQQAVGQTVRLGYAHHIQRLMVTGNFGLLAEVAPREVCDWYLAIYVDAVEWVELPNTAGMALYANGGRFTSKPYVASGAYIKRMSNYCDGCRYRPDRREGAGACPFTTLYWRFLSRREDELAANPRTGLMAKTLARLTRAERKSIEREGERILDAIDRI